nr:ribonuclease H-like domain-containing protein [Tanacetum cinerariifolium]
MHQFWYSIKKVQGTNSYEFLLDNKKCVVNANVFRTILDICSRVEGVNFTDVLDDDATLAFLIKLGYKGMFYRENVDYPELIWEDLAYQIDHRKEKRSRRKIRHFPNSPRICKDYQEYELPIPETMMTEAIKQSESYQIFIKYSTESEPEPQPVKRKTSSKRRVKKKVSLSADDNIILDDPDTALELGMSISKTEAEATRLVHATHAKIMENLKKTSKRQPGTKGSSEGTGNIPGVPDESTFIFVTSSEGTGTKPGVLDEENDITEENVILEWGLEQESEYSEEDKLDDEEKDDKQGDANDEYDETDFNEDDIYKYKIHVYKDEDEEMLNAEVKDYDKGDEEITDAAKANVEKTSEVKDDAKKTKLPPTSSSLSASLGPVSVISEPLVLTPIQQSPSIATVANLPPPSVSITPSIPQQTTTPIPTPSITTDAPIITTAFFEFDALIIVQLRVAKLEKDMYVLKKIDLSAEALAALKTQIPSVTLTVDQEQEYEKIPSKILKIKMEQAEKQKTLKFIIKNPANHRLYHALMEALIEDENEMDKGVVDTVQDHKRKHDRNEDDDDEDPPAGPNQGSKTGKSALTNEPVEKPIAEVVIDDAGDDVVRNDDQPQNASEPKTAKPSNPEWTYTTSITKTKAARYEIKGIEDIVPMLWSPTKVGYDKDALKGIKHFEIVEKRANRQFYKFKEGDFVDLHLNDIEDMLLLAVQHKLFHLTDSDIVDFIVALQNGNSFVPITQTTTAEDSTSTTLISSPVTTEGKVQNKNDVKARSMLLMAHPNEHLITFDQYNDAKTLFAAIQTRFGGNEATKKTNKTLLKQIYENFSTLSTESLDSICNML